MSHRSKAVRRQQRPAPLTDEPEPQVTDPETRERIREKIEAHAIDESGGPPPDEIGEGEPSHAGPAPAPGSQA